MDIDTVLDNILADTICELTFDGTIFESKVLNKFVEFVLAKSIKIHIKSDLRIRLDKIGLELLNHGCSEFVANYESHKRGECPDFPDNSLNFITHLNCDLWSLGDAFKVTQNLKSLERLRGIKISTTTSSVMHLLDEKTVQKLITWRRRRDCEDDCDCEGGCVCASHTKKHVVLSISWDYFLKNSSFIFVSRLIDLNRNGDFEIECREISSSESLGSHLLSDLHKDEMTLLKLLELKSPLDNIGLEDIAQISKDTDRRMALIEHEIPEDQDIIPRINFIAKKCATDFTEMHIIAFSSGFSFRHLESLKKLSLMYCTVSYDCLNCLPDTLLSLTMKRVNLEDSVFHEIRLPIHLKSLSVHVDLSVEILSNIVNRDQLGELTTVEINLNIYSTEGYTHTQRKESTYFFQLGKFLHELPILECLYLETNEVTNMKQMVEDLSLNTLDSLVGLSFNPDSSCEIDFPLSCLPPTCVSLQLGGFIALSGQFPETLNTLEIYLHDYSKSFDYFWDRFITPLNNLYCLKIYIPEITETIDFSFLQFPDRIHTFELVRSYGGVCKFIFNELPPSMIFVSLRCMASSERNYVVFHNVDDETLKSMKNKFVFDTENVL
ncbi:unnamed protein product [Ambrosiozyma monospora]|uniref:Unnamed protein product n=1 Tax=Ambrosiozyma monospora TaxID=43982 RepID=A0ACB5T341_AMBMO|nr:unnamed protein product [Ambrosiozyma monospora]